MIPPGWIVGGRAVVGSEERVGGHGETLPPFATVTS